MSTKADATTPQGDPDITLDFPFTTAAGVKITTIKTRRLTVKDLRSFSEQSGGNETLIETLGVARMCNMIPEDLDVMDAADYHEVKSRFLEYVGVVKKPKISAPAAGPVVPDAAE